MVISREPELQERWMQVCMRILPNDNFRLGYGNLETVKVSFSDILSEPSWWSSWANVFGPFYREVYLKWIEIYYEGADTTTSLENGEPAVVGQHALDVHLPQLVSGHEHVCDPAERVLRGERHLSRWRHVDTAHQTTLIP